MPINEYPLRPVFISLGDAVIGRDREGHRERSWMSAISRRKRHRVSKKKKENYIFKMHYLSRITLSAHLPESHCSFSAKMAIDLFFMEQENAGLFSSHKGGMMADQSLLRTSTV